MMGLRSLGNKGIVWAFAAARCVDTVLVQRISGGAVQKHLANHTHYNLRTAFQPLETLLPCDATR